LRIFNESEIPITITTSGINNKDKGIKIHDQSLRYKFHIEFYREDRSDSNPLEVLYVD